MARAAMSPVHRRTHPARVAPAWRAAAFATCALCSVCSALRAFLGLRPSLVPARVPLNSRRQCTRLLAAKWDKKTDPFLQTHNTEGDDPYQWLDREVVVEDVRDINELLKLPNPIKPAETVRLDAVTTSDGQKIFKPLPQDLRKLQPSKLRPVKFHWKDRSKVQSRAPKQYDEIIQRLLNAGPADMEELVRANWKMFDRGFFYRLTELKQDVTEERLREKIVNLEKIAMQVIKAAQSETRKTLPETAGDAREIMNSMLEGDEDTLLWPPPPESYQRLSDIIKQRATRSKYEDGWFETVLEITERFAQKMEVQQKTQLVMMAQVIMQRLVTEWLRHDSLWEETDEGRFLFRLMSISHEQWEQQLFMEKVPLDTYKLRDELKIISETKVVQLPMGSKLQVYAAKYLQGLVEFIEKKDEMLQNMGKPVER